MTVLRLCCRCLIRSRLEYGSFIYACASKAVLSVLDLVHNSAIRLCTGAFRTSRVESLNAEARRICACHSLTDSTVQMCVKSERPQEAPLLRSSIPAHSPTNISAKSMASRRAGIGFKEVLDTLHITTPAASVPEPHYTISATTRPAFTTFPRYPHLQAPSEGSVQRCSHTTHYTQLFLQTGV
jgi:hypothetical protein